MNPHFFTAPLFSFSRMDYNRNCIESSNRKGLLARREFL